MEASPANLEMLRGLLLQTLGSDNAARQVAEQTLNQVESQPGFMLVVLQLIHMLIVPSSPQDMPVRQAAAVLFKNGIKKRWHVADDSEDTEIPVDNRDAIKAHLVDLMCTAPNDIQKQLSESVSIISEHDFVFDEQSQQMKWGALLPQLISRSSTQDLSIIKGVMLTANSIMKRFRYKTSGDSLFHVIKYCCDNFLDTLLEKFRLMMVALAELSQAGNKDGLLVVMETLRLQTRIFYSLNWQSNHCLLSTKLVLPQY